MSAKKQLGNGKRVSKPGAQPWGLEPVSLDSPLGKLLAHIYDDFHERKSSKSYAQKRRDFVFHMTDWKSDLGKLVNLLLHPEKHDRDAAGVIVAGFLYHAIPHLKAAGRLLLDKIPDAFEPAQKKTH